MLGLEPHAGIGFCERSRGVSVCVVTSDVATREVRDGPGDRHLPVTERGRTSMPAVDTGGRGRSGSMLPRRHVHVKMHAI
jgi:hypothetical protein